MQNFDVGPPTDRSKCSTSRWYCIRASHNGDTHNSYWLYTRDFCHAREDTPCHEDNRSRAPPTAGGTHDCLNVERNKPSPPQGQTRHKTEASLGSPEGIMACYMAHVCYVIMPGTLLKAIGSVQYLPAGVQHLPRVGQPNNPQASRHPDRTKYAKHPRSCGSLSPPSSLGAQSMQLVFAATNSVLLLGLMNSWSSFVTPGGKDIAIAQLPNVPACCARPSTGFSHHI